jgi:hypothetical protein
MMKRRQRSKYYSATIYLKNTGYTAAAITQIFGGVDLPQYAKG